MESDVETRTPRDAGLPPPPIALGRVPLSLVRQARDGRAGAARAQTTTSEQAVEGEEDAMELTGQCTPDARQPDQQARPAAAEAAQSISATLWEGQTAPEQQAERISR